jgi:hypothetical protein
MDIIALNRRSDIAVVLQFVGVPGVWGWAGERNAPDTVLAPGADTSGHPPARPHPCAVGQR